MQLGLRVPPGFEVTEFADSKLANDIFSMTLDPRGRVAVSSRGYIRILIDDDGDGRADRAIDYASGPQDGAMGMLWEGDSLFVTGDGGLRRYRDRDGDGQADGPSELIRAMKTGGEHDAHDIKRGPDGWLYVMCGNMTGIDQSFAELPTSPIKDPVAGCVIRFSPDLKSSEIVADGYRNAYRMDWNADGELFTFDSDNERCVSLPWYEPTRFYHVISGGHYGWLAPQQAQWFRLPPYFVDVVAPAAYLGRGSPTGVACYRHLQFPKEYRGGMFLADWTFGRIYFLPLERAGASYTSTPQLFVEAVGDSGFAPTDLAVHPGTGDLFISIGGRGTRGAVYRVRYQAGVAGEPAAGNRTQVSLLSTQKTGDSRLSVPNPELLSLQPKPRALDWQPTSAAKLAEQTTAGDSRERLRALSLILRHRQRFSADQMEQFIRANWNHSDRTIRKSASDLIACLDKAVQLSLFDSAKNDRELATGALGTLGQADSILSWQTKVTKLLQTKTDVELQLCGIRLLQLAWGGVASGKAQGTIWEGYTLRTVPTGPKLDATTPQRTTQEFTPIRFDGTLRGLTVANLRSAFPADHPDLNREISRTLALVEAENPAVVLKVAEFVTAASNPIEDIHYLAVLARLRGPRTAEHTSRTARALLDLDRKIVERGLNRDRHWPLRVAELLAGLAEQDPGLNDAILNDPQFGRADHVLFAQCPGFDRRRAAEVFLAKARNDDQFAWSPALVEIVGSLPEEESLLVLRKQWENLGLQEAILQVLARHPEPEDRPRFLAGITSPQLATIGMCLGSLEELPQVTDGAEILPLVRAVRRLRGGKEEDRLRGRAGKLLQSLTGQMIAADDSQAWTDWFVRSFPKWASRLGGEDGVDIAAWNDRLAKLVWSTGDAERGREVFTKTGCVACHSGARAVGPDLRGVASRFSRDDLFTAILQPSKDVSPRYQTTLVATQDGKTYQGTIIYEAVDSLILQTGADTTIRITNNLIVERRVTPNSLMPTGLLDKLTDQETADLYAFLKSLR